jgi:hypothetical protein
MSVKLFLLNHCNQLLNNVLPKRKKLANLRAKWLRGEEKICFQASRYFDLTRDKSKFKFVDDKTWLDLEFPKIFSLLDSTETSIGSQVFYRKLRYYNEKPSELAEHYAACTALRTDAELRENIQLQLAHLNFESNAYIADYIFGAPTEKPKYMALLPWWGIFCALTFIAAIAFSWSIWVWLAIFAINGFIIYQSSPVLHRNIEILIGCDQMLRVADSLASLHSRSPDITQLSMLAEETPLRESVKNTLGWLAFMQKPVLENITVFLNIMFLAQFIAYARTVDRFVHFRAKLTSTFELVGSIDAAIAIASYLERQPEHCQPVISDVNLLDIQGGYHPLLKKPVKNSICLNERSALIAGSNMAGKTTFIKMIGINIILGRTLGFCMSSKATLPMSGVMASIKNEHSVESGKSNYFAELEAIRLFIINAERGNCKIFLIDELFNGTNTVERLAIARAVLESISKSALVLATTHDVELQADLTSHYDQFYFKEDPNVDGYFDWQIRPGVALSRNAIQLLEREGFPKEIVDNASTYTIKYANRLPSML